MNNYESRQEDKRQRMLEKAAKSRGEAERAHQGARQTLEAIPPGQPILVGHHSERRHRRDLEKIDRGFRKAHEAEQRAENLERRAAAVGTGGISADDPDAVKKLKEKLAKMEDKRSRMKEINTAFRKSVKTGGNGWDTVREMMGAENAERLQVYSGYTGDRVPFPKYSLQNLGANIRRVKERVESLKVEKSRTPAEPQKHEGFEIVERPDINRVTIVFDVKPNRETCQIMRRNGFRFSRREMAWMRQLNNAGRYAAENAAKEINNATKDFESACIDAFWNSNDK